MSGHNHEKRLFAGPVHKCTSLAKLSMPRLAKGILRPRLHAVLDESRRAPAVWIVAPGGAGKTTLVATYIAERKFPYLWYQLDKDDADPATFFYYLGLAATEFQRQDGVVLPLLTPEYLHDVSGFARRYFRRLFTLLPRESAVVLDNFQDLGANDAADEILRNAIGEVPDGGNIIVVSRTPPSPAMVRLQVTGALEVIGWEELRLRYEETEAIVRRHSDDLETNVIHALHERSEGWVAGLTLMLKQVKKSGVNGQEYELDSLERVFDFFATEFFDGLPAATRAFLLQTSLLTHITPDLAFEVSGNSDAAAILADFHRQHLFTSRLNLPESTYQYHALFREFLLARAAATYTRGQYLDLTRRAGKLLEKHGRNEEAIELYLHSRTWAAAIALILNQAPHIVSQSRAQIVAGWIQRIPEAEVSKTPWLMYWQGISRQFTNPFEARTILEQAHAGFVDGQDVIGQLSAASAIVDIAFFLRESLVSTKPWIDVLQKSVATNLTYPSSVVEARVLSSLLSVLMYLRPQDPMLPHYVDRLVILLDGDLEPNQKVLMGAHLVNYYAHVLGDISACERVILRISPLLSAPQVTVVNQIMWKCFCVLPSLLSGRSDVAYEMMQSVLALIRDNNLPFVELIANFYMVLVHLSGGDRHAARPLVESMTAAMNPVQPADAAWLYLAKCWYALAEDDRATAFQQGQAALREAAGVGAVLTETDINCFIALERCLSGKFDEALDYLAMPRQLGFGSSPRLRYQVLLIEAYIFLRKGSLAHCRRQLRRALAIGRYQLYFGSLYCWFPKDMMAGLCTEALKCGIEVDYTQRLIRRLNLLPADPDLESWPWPVRIYTLGRFKLIINGQPHSVESKAHFKPLRLLKVLIALGGKDVKEAEISEILWPDAEGDAAHSALTTTLSRLRKLIGDESIAVNRGRLSMNRQRCWLDAWCLEGLYDRLRQRDVEPSLRYEPMENIICLYRGPFMGDEESVWVERQRQRLQTIYDRIISSHGSALNDTHKQESDVINPC